MDMKKILQAFDGVQKSSSSVEGTSDMKRFLNIISPNTTSEIKESVISSFDEDSIGGEANAYLLAADKINDEIMGQIEKIKINADPELLKELMDKFNAFMSAYHAVGKEILQPDLFKDSLGENKIIPKGHYNDWDHYAYDPETMELKKSWSDKELSAALNQKMAKERGWSVKPGSYFNYGKEKLSIAEEIEILESDKEELEQIANHPAADDPRIQKAVKDKKKDLETTEEGSKIPFAGSEVGHKQGPKGWLTGKMKRPAKAGDLVGGTESLNFKDYFSLEEAKKKISAKDDPCWKGYKMVGTKNKDGREVPNCVPGKKGD